MKARMEKVYNREREREREVEEETGESDRVKRKV